MKVTARQIQIYNSYLYAARKAIGKPFRARKNFSTMKEDDGEYVALLSLDRMFNSYPHISFDDFFKAPYEVYPDTKYNPISFYTTHKAKKLYTEYVKRRETDSPDSDITLEHSRECVKFIASYCISNNLTIEDYKNEKLGQYYTFMLHLKSHDVSLYVLHSLEVDSIVRGMDPVLVDFAISDFYKNFRTTRLKYLNSKKLKPYLRSAIKIVEENMLKHTK